jgi:hypothetical protein
MNLVVRKNCVIIARMREAVCFTSSQSADSGPPDIQDGTMA